MQSLQTTSRNGTQEEMHGTDSIKRFGRTACLSYQPGCFPWDRRLAIPGNRFVPFIKRWLPPAYAFGFYAAAKNGCCCLSIRNSGWKHRFLLRFAPYFEKNLVTDRPSLWTQCCRNWQNTFNSPQPFHMKLDCFSAIRLQMCWDLLHIMGKTICCWAIGKCIETPNRQNSCSRSMTAAAPICADK